MASVSKDAASEDDVMMAVLEAGAEDVRAEEETFDVITPPEALPAVREALQTAGIPFLSAEVTMVPPPRSTSKAKRRSR